MGASKHYKSVSLSSNVIPAANIDRLHSYYSIPAIEIGSIATYPFPFSSGRNGSTNNHFINTDQPDLGQAVLTNRQVWF